MAKVILPHWAALAFAMALLGAKFWQRLLPSGTKFLSEIVDRTKEIEYTHGETSCRYWCFFLSAFYQKVSTASPNSHYLSLCRSYFLLSMTCTHCLQIF